MYKCNKNILSLKTKNNLNIDQNNNDYHFGQNRAALGFGYFWPAACASILSKVSWNESAPINQVKCSVDFTANGKLKQLLDLVVGLDRLKWARVCGWIYSQWLIVCWSVPREWLCPLVDRCLWNHIKYPEARSQTLPTEPAVLYLSCYFTVSSPSASLSWYNGGKKMLKSRHVLVKKCQRMWQKQTFNIKSYSYFDITGRRKISIQINE